MTRTLRVTRALLRRMPLPAAASDDDKQARGQVLVVGGAGSVPGAVLLSGVAALRAGAGKLQLATVQRAAIALGIAVPEALVIGLPQGRSGEIAGTRAAALLHEHASRADALLVGPGMSAARAAHALVAALVRRLGERATLVLDAAAVEALVDDEQVVRPLGGRCIITPHAGEMASLLDIPRDDVEAHPADVAQLVAGRYGVLVVLKGPASWIAHPDGRLLRYDAGGVGLATSGSGDTLAGIVAGLAARGAEPITAAAWATFLHGAAGQRLARRMGRVGFLARELLDEIPGVMAQIG